MSQTPVFSDDARFKFFGVSVRLTRQNFSRMIIVGVVVGFATVLVAGLFMAYTVKRNQDFNAAVEHTFQVQSSLSNAMIVLERAEAARRGYLLSRDRTYRDTFDDAATQLPAALDRLKVLTADNPRQQARLTEIHGMLTPHIASLAQSVAIVGMGGQPAAIRMFQADQTGENMRRLRTLMAAMAVEEGVLLKSREAEQASSARSLYTALWVTAPLLLLVALGSTLIIFRYTRDLAASGDALQRLNESLEEAVAERTSDLTRANDEIQRFAYIVSHDLRSPLVNVMGFTAELETVIKPLSELIEKTEAATPGIVTREAREAVKVELPEAIGFIRSSTQKMDRLINAILELSRSGRRTLRPEPLDMATILGEVADTLKTRALDAGAEITVLGHPPDLVADRLTVEQVFSNLAENAVKYLKPGRPGQVEISGERQGSRIVYEVRDNGRGIDPRDHERIFELFRRSGVQDRPGEGIGLANVRALVYRLGGTIQCESALDQGAVFRVSLPSALSPRQDTE